MKNKIFFTKLGLAYGGLQRGALASQSPTSKARAPSDRHILYFAVIGRANTRIRLSLRINISLIIGGNLQNDRGLFDSV